MVRIKRTGKFEKMLEELVEKDPEIIDLVRDRIKQFESNPEDTRLDNHPLRKSMEGKWAFSLTGDVRIVYEWLGKSSVRFLAIGRHTGVYGG